MLTLVQGDYKVMDPLVMNLFSKQVLFNFSTLFGEKSKETNKWSLSFSHWRLVQYKYMDLEFKKVLAYFFLYC